MKIFLNILVVAGFALALFIVTKTFEIPHREYQEDPGLFLYDQGNASPAVRTEIMQQLELFQKGYTERDTSILESYMRQLFSTENILILGTMPGEIYSGYVEAADLVSSDWLIWGDVSMLPESSNISASDSMTWVLYVTILLTIFLLVSISRLVFVVIRTSKKRSGPNQ